jgi:hypothetical protein
MITEGRRPRSLLTGKYSFQQAVKDTVKEQIAKEGIVNKTEWFKRNSETRFFKIGVRNRIKSTFCLYRFEL